VAARRRLLRWGGWFALVNAGVLALVGLRYLWYYSAVGPSVAWIYALAAFVGQMAVFAFVPLLLLVPVILLLPSPRLIVPLGVGLGSTVLSFLVLDSLLFADNRYHLSVLTFTLLAPQTWGFLVLYFVMALAIEAMLAFWVWRRTAEAPRHHPRYCPRPRMGRWIALGIVACFVASHLVHLWAEAHYYVPVTSFTRYLPLYFPLKDSRKLARLGLVDQARAREHSLVTALGRPPGGELHYPRAPLRCEPRRPLLNVLLVVVDAMRADSLAPALAPHMAGFSEWAIRFDGHVSGGNSSRAGMFSIFYGLPASYWDAFADDLRPPVIMDLFRTYGYQLGLFASSPVYSWVVGLDRTALARVPNLRQETKSPYPGSSGRDRTLTDDWLQWLDGRDPSRPFFGFLYYNAVAANQPIPDLPAPPLPAEAPEQARRYTRYLTNVRYVDALVGRVLDDLERRNLLESTVVILTSDHGTEFNEHGHGFTGHGTSFSAYQVQTPFVLRWPGRPPARISRRTSHNDLAPTLLTELFGCANPPADYASGQSLFSDGQWEWVITLSHNDFALLEPHQVTIVYPSGSEVRDQSYRLVQHPRLSRDKLRAAMQEMSRFFN
jgi:membrane-anchored protein YejM (alkaline phosphatase superfamily)